MEAIYNSVPTVTVRLDTRCLLKKTNNYPVRLELYYNYTKAKYTLPIKLTIDEWEKIHSSKLKNKALINEKKNLKFAIDKAETIIKELGNNFSFSDFELLYFETKAKKVRRSQDAYEGFKEKMDECEQQAKFGTAGIYRDAMIALKKYQNKLNYSQITIHFLNNFESYLINERNYSISTVALYMRCLRHIMKRAIKAKIITKNMLPFKKNGNDDEDKKYTIPASENHKRTLNETDLIKLLNYKPTWEGEAKAFALWCFCFFCNGMNPADAFKLKYEQLNGDFLEYVRQKTASTTKQKMTIHIYNSPMINAIVRQWGNKDRSPNNYVFDIFNHNQTPKEQFHARKLYIRVMNDRMQDIAKKLGIKTKVTTLVARHSWATTLMRNGYSTAFIQKGFGHTSITTTEFYLGDFTNEQKKEAALVLSNLIR